MHIIQALARDESEWPAWYGLGETKAAQGKYADAVEAFSRWLQGEQAEGEGGDGRAALKAKGLVQLGDAQRALGQVRSCFLLNRYSSVRG